MMKKLFIGPCPLCNLQIWEMKDKKLIQNENGTHFWILSNHRTIARFAICKNCLKALNMEKIAEIVDRQVYTWLMDLFKEEKVNRYQFDKYRFYCALTWAKTEEEILSKCKPASS